MDIRQNIKDGLYQTKLPYPVLGKESQAGLDASNGIIVLATKEEVHLARRARMLDNSVLKEAFKRDALDSVGLTNHPKANRCYELALEHGGDDGLERVLGCLEDFAELVLP